MKKHIGAITLIAIGIIFQIDMYFDKLNIFGYVIRNFWPMILIFIGISMIINKKGL
ncbi:MAG TPA: DUF5668 domain-containing protein [Flavobacteriaceae bacterium]|jgi:hypothetical protein|nr:DUF5668 domain-containing protein [Flavobacteriaceae bacterium]